MSTTTKERQQPKMTQGADGRASELIEGLNEDLAGELQAMIMYLHYSATLTGPYRQELRNLFQGEIADEQGHAQFLSDKIADHDASPRARCSRPEGDAAPRTRCREAGDSRLYAASRTG
jgi:rubrerythrin